MHSDPITPEDPTLAALGLEKSLLPNWSPDDVATAREVQDVAALTWLAVAHLQPAPESIWRGVQSQIIPTGTSNPTRSRWQFPITYGGWAAAAALAVCWWLQGKPPAILPGFKNISHEGLKVIETTIVKKTSPDSTQPSGQEDSSLRDELLQLRQRLANAARQPDIPGLHRPAIVDLRAPGQTEGAPSPGGAAARLQQLVTRALQRDLILRDSRDGSDIVLERGWPTTNWLPNDSGHTIRHLSFPADRWEELGLWKSAALFYDPATSLTWAPAPDGLGYLGSVTPTSPDPGGFTKPRPKQELAAPSTAPKPQSKPSGYLVSEPGNADATLLLSDLPPLPEGGQQFVIASNANGVTRQYQIAGSSVTGSDSLTNITASAGYSVDSLTLSSLSLSGSFTNFQVVQSSTERPTPIVILTGGQP